MSEVIVTPVSSSNVSTENIGSITTVESTDSNTNESTTTDIDSSNVNDSNVSSPDDSHKDSSPDNDDEFVKRFNALSRKEKQLAEERAKVKAWEAEQAKYQQLRESKDPMAVLESFGISPDDVVDALLGGSSEEEDNTPSDPAEALKKEFEDFKRQIEEEKQRKIEEQQTRQQEEEQAIIDNHKKTIDSFIQENSDKYELITARGEQELVWDVTEAHFNEYGKVLTIEEASDMVEQYLEQEVQKLLKLKKFSNLTKSGQEEVNEKVLQEKPITTTLVNDLNSNSSASSTPKRQMTREQLLREASKKLVWND